MKLKIKKINKDACLPEFAHPDDAGMDLFSIEDKNLKAGEKYLFQIGVALEIPTGFVGLIWDKSGLAANSGIKTMGGVIDAGYRGEIKITILNTSKKIYQIKKGDKIAQILIQKIEHPKIIEADELSNAERNDKGFGSTGR